MAEGKFVTTINCMDGRTQGPVSKWMKETFKADHVDTITIPGADRALTRGTKDEKDSIKNMINISVNKHDSEVISIIGHHDCAGNPGSKEMHIEDIKASMQTVRDWFTSVHILGLWVGSDWKVELIHELD